MGTNYYRIPSVSEMEERKARLQRRVEEMTMTPENIERNFNTIPIDGNSWEYNSPWSEFVDDVNVHLGKRSMGWKFLWNFHNNKYYHNLESLLEFINSGRVVNEYGEELPIHEFVEMALTWGGVDGYDLETYYKAYPPQWPVFAKPERYVEGLRISDSVDFC